MNLHRLNNSTGVPQAQTSPKGIGHRKMNEPIKKREGYRSPKNGHLGVYTLCSGPDPKGPCPGESLKIVIYDSDNSIARTLEQVRGNCLDPGWVDFFNSTRCHPAVHDYLMVDTDRQGNRQVLAHHVNGVGALEWLQNNVPLWVKEHGILQE